MKTIELSNTINSDRREARLLIADEIEVQEKGEFGLTIMFFTKYDLQAMLALFKEPKPEPQVVKSCVNCGHFYIDKLGWPQCKALAKRKRKRSECYDREYAWWVDGSGRRT